MALPYFPDVETGAIIDLADILRLISFSAADVGIDAQNLRDAVVGNQLWEGISAQRWHDVVTERIGDAGLTNDVMGSAALTLSQLATDLESERSTYNNIRHEISGEMRTLRRYGEDMTPEEVDPTGVAALASSVARAEGLLDQAANELLGLAILAGDIRAQPAANRTPGIPDGTDRNQASLQLLTILFGSVRDNQLSGREFEETVLQELGIPKNTTVWRPDPAFEGRLTKSGLARGTTPEGTGDNFILEVKGTESQVARFQQRLQAEYARQTGRPLWIIKRAGTPANDSVTQLAENTRGGVIYRTGPNTYVDGNGNPVQVTYDENSKTLTVNGYTRSTPPGGGPDPANIAPPDPYAPSKPVDPEIAEGGTGAAPVEPGGEPIEPVEPVEPVEPIEPIEPIIP